MVIHFCEQVPCQLQNKELVERLRAGFLMSYVKDDEDEKEPTNADLEEIEESEDLEDDLLDDL